MKQGKMSVISGVVKPCLIALGANVVTVIGMSLLMAVFINNEYMNIHAMKYGAAIIRILAAFISGLLTCILRRGGNVIDALVSVGCICVVYLCIAMLAFELDAGSLGWGILQLIIGVYAGYFAGYRITVRSGRGKKRYRSR